MPRAPDSRSNWTGRASPCAMQGRARFVATGRRAVVSVGFHSPRLQLVSMCRAAGVSLSVVESLVGHSNPTMTRLYTHTSGGERPRRRSRHCRLLAEATQNRFRSRCPAARDLAGEYEREKLEEHPRGAARGRAANSSGWHLMNMARASCRRFSGTYFRNRLSCERTATKA